MANFFTEDDINKAFKEAFFTFNSSDFSGGFNWSTSTSQSFLNEDEKKLLTQIQDETKEYFEKQFKRDLSNKLNRETLDKESRERMVDFMKGRLKWYNENGFLLSAQT